MPDQPGRRALDHLCAVALGYPQAVEEFPSGERVVKVRGKIFVFFGTPGEDFGMSVKLPDSHPIALAQPFTSPSSHGLGRAGWVTVRYPPGEDPPLDMLEDWLDESYRSVAPKSLVATLPEYSLGVSEPDKVEAR